MRNPSSSRGRLVVVVAATAALTACSSGANSTAGRPARAPASGSTTTGVPAGKGTVRSTVTSASSTLQIATAPWQLPSARAREVVLAADGALLVIGGLDASGASTARVWHVALPGGPTTRLAVLPQTIHDSAGAVIGRDLYLFGGGSATELATVQHYRAGASSVVGKMPQARSDLVAAVVNCTAYVLGGFDGTNSIASVLATTDGATFRTVAQLPQTVRYPAAAVDGSQPPVTGHADGPSRAALATFAVASASAFWSGVPEFVPVFGMTHWIPKAIAAASEAFTIWRRLT